MNNREIGAKISQYLRMVHPETYADLFMPDGSARQATWIAEDGWYIVYTTERVDRGRWAGRFVTMAYRPTGKGARSGKAETWQRVYARPFASRTAAKKRALDLYADHSPKFAAYGHSWRTAPTEGA